MVDSQVGLRGFTFGDVAQPHGLSVSAYSLCMAESEQKFDAFSF